MRIPVVVGTALAAVVLQAWPSIAGEAPWCVIGETPNCLQPSLELCRFVAQGDGGYCSPNPAYLWASNAPALSGYGPRRPHYALTTSVALAQPHALALPGLGLLGHGYRALRDYAMRPMPRYRPLTPAGESPWCLTGDAADCAQARAASRPGSSPNPNPGLLMATLDGRSAPARANAMAVAKVAASCGEAASGVPSLVREPATCAVDADSVPLQTAAPAAAPGRALAAFAMAVDGDAAPMITSMLPAAARAALAPSDAVPSLDIPKTCRETGEAAMRLIPGSGDAVDACLRSEQSAREQMAKDWAGYSSSDKARCIRPAAYLPSYAEWLTCLEMEREVRKMRAERTVPAPQRQ